MALRTYVLEICAETMESVSAATEGGADCIELCSALALDGVTPSEGFLHATLQSTSLPVHVLVRPRAGNFVYSGSEVRVSFHDVERAKAAGAHGVVIGALTPDGRVEAALTRELVLAATPMCVTFHRAFDICANLDAALELLIETGVNRILTSGGSGTALDSTNVLARLVQIAAGRIDIVAGGGVRAENIRQLADTSGLTFFHSSLRPAGTMEPVLSISAAAVKELLDALAPGA